jgi:type I restriction enzyme S subunit
MRLQRGHDLPAQEREEGEVPVVSSSGITGHHNKAKAAAPGVVTGRYGTLGDVFFLEQDFWPLNTALYVTDFKGNDPRFTAYFLRNALKDYQSDKAAVPGIDRNVLHDLKVRAPGLQLQLRIAGLLANYDDLIDNNRRRIKLLDESAQMLYDEWFVKLRFPGHESCPQIESLPAGWSRVALEEVLVLQRGFDLPSQDREAGDVPIYGATGVVGFHNKAKVSGPGLVTGRSGSLGEVHFVAQDFWPLNTALWVKEFKRATPLFALHLLRGMNLSQYNGGVSVPTLDRKVVHKATVLLPSASTMKQFETVAEDVYRQIHTLSAMNDKLRTARDLLLPRLMSGELTV